MPFTGIIYFLIDRTGNPQVPVLTVTMPFTGIIYFLCAVTPDLDWTDGNYHNALHAHHIFPHPLFLESYEDLRHLQVTMPFTGIIYFLRTVTQIRYLRRRHEVTMPFTGI